MSETAFYLFCFARPGLLPELAGTGVDGQGPLLVHSSTGLAAVLSTVLVEDFCGPEAEARMEDLSWLGIRAWRHEAVIERVMAHSPVFPARFGTLFSSLESLERLLQRHRDTISQFLDRVTDHEEWGIKGLLDREKALQELQSRYKTERDRQKMDLSALPPGMRYLQEQRARAAAEKELQQWLSKTCAEVADDLRGYATDFSTRKAGAAAAQDGAPEIVLNWAFLTPKSARADLCGRVERASAELADQGLTFEITGPWPPYNFTPPLTD
jgi:hypothetical protein